MLTRPQFDNYNIGRDPYQGVRAKLRLDDLEYKKDRPIKLSILTSTYHRVSQLERSLECLARQNWKDFEVLVCDDGDDNDLTPIFQTFEPYLHLKTIRRERKQFHVDPTGGFRELLPLSSGEIVAIMQPEIMLRPEAASMLYHGHFQPLPGETRYSLSEIRDDSETWVALKVLFMSPSMMAIIESADWHTDLDALHGLYGFWEIGCGLSNRENNFWKDAVQFPWWFVASAKRDAGVFTDMPEFLGHASIDFWTLTYRHKHNYLDIVPFRPMGYHQDHHRIAIGVEGEQELVGKKVQETMK